MKIDDRILTAVRGNNNSLDLSACRLTSEDLKALIPYILEALPGLQKLKLDNNSLTDLPPEIGRLTNLQALDLSYNRLTGIPRQIGRLKHLERLDLSFNRLTGIPRQIGRLGRLKGLDLSSNELTGIPRQIGGLSHLKQLDLSSNQFTHIPREIGLLRRLEFLSLNHCLKLTELPSQILKLHRLPRLSAENVPLNPDAMALVDNISHRARINNSFDPIEELRNLSTRHQEHILNLSGCALTSEDLKRLVPIIKQKFPNLKTLVLTNNRLKSILPAEIAYLNQVNCLNINSNPLTSRDMRFLDQMTGRVKYDKVADKTILRKEIDDHIDRGPRFLPRSLYRLYFNLFVKKDFVERFNQSYKENKLQNKDDYTISWSKVNTSFQVPQNKKLARAQKMEPSKKSAVNRNNRVRSLSRI